MILTILLSLLVLFVTLLVVRCLKPRPADSAPRVSLSWVLPSAVLYASNPLEFLRIARAKCGNAFSFPFPAGEVTVLFGPDKVQHFFDIPDAQYSIYVAAEATVLPLCELPDGRNGFRLDQRWYDECTKYIHRGFWPNQQLDVYSMWIRQEVDLALTNWARLGQIDLLPQISRMIIGIGVRAMLGEQAYQKHIAELASNYLVMEHLLFTPDVLMMPWWLPTPRRSRFRAAHRRVYEICHGVVQDFVDNKVPKADRQAYVGFLIDNANMTSYQNYIDVMTIHVLTLLFVSHTNSAAATLWGVMQAAHDPSIVVNIRNEQKSIAEKHGAGFPFTLDIVSEMTWLDRYFRETVRTMGTPLLMRMAITDVTVPNSVNRTGTGPIVIHRGEMVAISPSLHQAEVHANPEQFDVSRWDTPEKINDIRARFGYLQFGFGRHRCIGERFANIEVKMLWALLYEHYDVEVVAGADAKKDFKRAGAPLPDRSIRVQLRPRAAPAPPPATSS